MLPDVKASYARHADGTRIAYDRAGDGEPLVLLHGGFVQDRRSWWTAGYVDRLQDEGFKLLVIDLRGHGESDHPAKPDAYSADKVVADVAAVLDAERVPKALVWGYSYGAGVALQLARATDRVSRMALGGAALGQWLSPDQAQKTAAGMRGLTQARKAGAGAIDQLPPAQQEFARTADLDASAAIFQAMAAWPAIEPASIKVPAFFYAGSENPLGSAQIKTHQDALSRAGVRWAILDGLDHMGEFNRMDRALPACLEFLRAR
jgi:pimeloyl-ACP methyl ester carboxylesterase